MKKCPFCAEDIQEAATVCRYCHRDLEVYADQKRLYHAQRAPQRVLSEIRSQMTPLMVLISLALIVGGTQLFVVGARALDPAAPSNQVFFTASLGGVLATCGVYPMVPRSMAGPFGRSFLSFLIALVFVIGILVMETLH